MSRTNLSVNNRDGIIFKDDKMYANNSLLIQRKVKKQNC